jgi:hypothetical protein
MEGLNTCYQPWQSLVVVTSVKFSPLVLGLSTAGETDTFFFVLALSTLLAFT